MKKGITGILVVVGTFLTMLLLNRVLNIQSDWGNLYWMVPIMAGMLAYFIISFNKK